MDRVHSGTPHLSGTGFFAWRYLMNKPVYCAAVILILALVPFPADADETPQQIALLASFAFVDYTQSVDMFFQNDGYHELNPVLGPYPSRTELLSFGVIGIGLTYVLAAVLPHAWKDIVIDSVIATERLNIEDNRLLYKGWNSDGPPLRGRTMAGIPIVVSMKF
jgi:hypothetical protein